MKRTYQFAKATGTVTCELAPGRTVTVPVIPGILKHPQPEQLPGILIRPGVVEKYTAEALRKASWPILRQFPRAWLRECLQRASLDPARREALMFLLA